MRDGVWFALLSILFLPDISHAICSQSSLDDEIQRADVIFAGTLDRSELARVGSAIITRYHFTDVRYIKGAGAASGFLMAQPGGLIGNEGQYSEDAVEFDSNRRYVIFAYDGNMERLGGYFVPQICGSSPFGIAADSGSDVLVVHARSGAALLEVDDRHVIALYPWAWEEGYPVPSRRPGEYDRPGRSIREEVRLADSAFIPSPEQYVAHLEGKSYPIRFVMVWPHQDPGSRVTEEQFTEWLRRQIARLSQAPTRLPSH